MKVRPYLCFFWAELVVCALVFGDALIGRSLLAPLDIAPALFSKYQYLSPGGSKVPANHYVIDQLTYDLPLQHTIYEAYRRGEIPWWDPYTYAGRPLLADAHINGTDPVRVLLYQILPFSWAYNWTRIIHSVLTGLGMFLLLRHWGHGVEDSILWSLTYQFAGCQALFFGHPWIQASFVYYPFLWFLWDRSWQQSVGWLTVLSALAVAAVFYAGNLQSHAYLPLFVLAFVWGYKPRSLDQWLKMIATLGLSCSLGACLALPVLLGQIEFFRLGVRTIEPTTHVGAWLSGLASLSALYPWALGTFRTLDLGKFLSQSGLGFHLFIGCAGFLLALLGGFFRPLREERHRPRRTALVLVIIYFLVLSTPLLGVFYTRCAGLGVMGLVILASFALPLPAQAADRRRRLGGIVLTLGLIIAVVTNVAGLIVYPRLLPKVREMVARQSAAKVSLDEAPGLREFQVNNLPKEVTFRNPETILACLSLLALGGWLLTVSAKADRWIKPVLWLNLIPVLMFCHRFIPHHPVGLWRELQAGGPEQKRVAAVMGGTSLRLIEKAPGIHEQVFPNALSHLYQVRTVHGYSALRPRCLEYLSDRDKDNWRNQMADYAYVVSQRGQEKGDFQKVEKSGWSRFQWRESVDRAFQIEENGLNEIRLHFAPGVAGTLWWTDTYYPGWTAKADGRIVSLSFLAPCFSTVVIAPETHLLVLHYQPTGLRLGRISAISGLVVLLGLGWRATRRRRGKGRT